MPKFVVTKTKDQQRELHPYLSTPQRAQQEPQSSSLLNENKEEKTTTPLKILKRFFGWFTQDNKKSNTTEQFLTINYPIDEELDRIVLPPLDLPLNPNAPNLVTAQPRLPPSQRPCIAYSEEDYSCFPYHEFDPKHPILGEHYESAHEVTLFFKNLSPYEYEVAKAVKDNLLKKCIWTPSYLVYENRRIMYSARLLAITTHLNYESFEFYKYTYDYTTNTATIIAPVFKSNPSKSDEVSSIQATSVPIDFTTKSHTLVGKPVKSDYIHSDLYEDKWLADLEKYFSDKKAAAAKEAEKKAKLLAEAKAAAEKKETPAPAPVSKTSFVTPLSKPTPAFGAPSSTLPLSTDESSAKKRPLATTEEPPLKAPSVFGQSSFFQQSQTPTFSQSSSTKNKRQLSDTEDEEPRSNSSKKHTITESEDITDEPEADKQPKPFTFSFTKPAESSKPATDIKADEQPKPTSSFFGFGKASEPVVPSSKPETASTFSFDFGKPSSTATKKPSPYQSSSTLFSKPDLKTVSDGDDEKESHLEKTELHNIPIVPFGGDATTLPKPSFSFGSNTDTPAFGKFNTLNTSSKPDAPKTAENEQTEKVETSTASAKPLEEKPATATFSGFSFGQKPASLPDKAKETEALSSQADTSSIDAKPEEIKSISVPSVLVTDSESSDKEKPKPASPFGSFFTPKATTLPEADSDKAKSESTPKTTTIPTFSFGTSLTKTTIGDSTPISATQATSTPFVQTTTALVPLKPSESSTQTSTAINIDSKPTEQLPAPSPGSPMSITPLQATPEKNDSMQISPPRAPNSPLSTFKQAVNPFQASTTSTALGASTTFKPQTSQFPKFTTNPFANTNPTPQSTSAPLSTNKFPTTKFNARPRPNVQPLGSTNTSVDPFASSSFSPTSNTGFNNSMPNNSFGSSNAPNPFGSTNSFAANNNNNASSPFGSTNSFATNTNSNATNSFGSTNSFGANNSNNPSNSFGSNNSFGSANNFGANNNNNASNSFGSTNSFGANNNNSASNSFGSNNNFGSSGFGNNASNSFGSNNSFSSANSFGANNNSNSPNPFSATNSFGSNNNNAPNSFGSANNFGQSGFGTNNNAFGSNNNFGSPSFQSGAGHFEENGTPNALPNHLNMNQNPGFSSRTNSINSGGFSSGPNSVTSRDGSPSSSNSHMAGRPIAQPKSRRRN